MFHVRFRGEERSDKTFLTWKSQHPSCVQHLQEAKIRCTRRRQYAPSIRTGTRHDGTGEAPQDFVGLSIYHSAFSAIEGSTPQFETLTMRISRQQTAQETPECKRHVGAYVHPNADLTETYLRLIRHRRGHGLVQAKVKRSDIRCDNR